MLLSTLCSAPVAHDVAAVVVVNYFMLLLPLLPLLLLLLFEKTHHTNKHTFIRIRCGSCRLLHLL